MPVAVGSAPAVRRPDRSNPPPPWIVGPNTGQGNATTTYGPPTYLPGTNPTGTPGYAPSGPQNLSPGGGAFLTDTNGNFTGGDAAAYARNYAGMYPNGTVGQYQDPLSLAARNAAQGNYGANIASLDRTEGGIKTSFEELLGALNRSKTRNVTSLADSMADRGLTNSGIYLGSTDELNRNYAEQLSGQTRQRDNQLNDVQSQRVNVANALAQALAAADQEAYNRRIKAYDDMYQAGLRQAQDVLRQQGLLQ